MAFTFYFDPVFFLLVLLRLTGAIIINPIFGRKNVPNPVKAGLALLLALILVQTTQAESARTNTLIEFVIKGTGEFAIGYAISLIMNIFLSAVTMACEAIDFQIGISMAKIYDPGSNRSSSLTGSIFYSFLILLFFVANGHLTFFNMLKQLFTAIPCGSQINLAGAGYVVLCIMSGSLCLALKFALPIIAIEFMAEIGMGVLSRAVPNINVFSVGIQARILSGVLVLTLITPAFGSFCDLLFSEMFKNITYVLSNAK
ncbi:MAG: flagellar biosynthetic protein FliR [Clostridiales bacterium]|nr:flagellar biosynthetic protein FliR [Clostridiales bacterium]